MQRSISIDESVMAACWLLFKRVVVNGVWLVYIAKEKSFATGLLISSNSFKNQALFWWVLVNFNGVKLLYVAMEKVFATVILIFVKNRLFFMWVLINKHNRKTHRWQNLPKSTNLLHQHHSFLSAFHDQETSIAITTLGELSICSLITFSAG